MITIAAIVGMVTWLVMARRDYAGAIKSYFPVSKLQLAAEAMGFGLMCGIVVFAGLLVSGYMIVAMVRFFRM